MIGSGGSVVLTAAPSAFFPIAIHTDFGSLVTEENPAWPDEILHFCLGGLGPVDPHVSELTPAPANRPARTVRPLRCEWLSTGFETGLLFAGLAPGMIGVYQVSLRAPREPVRDPDQITCRFVDPLSENASIGRKG